MGWFEWSLVGCASLAVGATRFFYDRAARFEAENKKLLEERTASLLRIRELSHRVATYESAAHLLPLRISQERRIREQKP